jgi:hypothetical protein
LRGRTTKPSNHKIIAAIKLSNHRKLNSGDTK